MEESNKHINQKPDGNYTKPGVPVGDAWANMKDMLDSEMPANTTSTAANTSWIQALKFVLPLIIVAGYIYLFIVKNDKTKSQTSTEFPVTRQSNSEKNDKVIEKNFEKLTAEKERSGKNITKKTNDNDSVKSILPDVESKKISSDKSNSSNLPPNLSLENTFNKPENSLSKSKKHALDNSVSFKLKPLNPAKKVTQHGFNEKETDKVKSAENSPLSSTVIRRRKNVSFQEQLSNGKEIEKNDLISNRKRKGSNVLKSKNSSFSTSGTASENSSVLRIADLKILSSRTTSKTSALKQKFESIPIKGQFVKPLDQTAQKQNTQALLSGLHVGLQWNTNLPLKDFGRFFTGTNQTNQFYSLFIPGIWASKTLRNGNQVLIKFNPFNQYFGNNQQIDSSSTSTSDSTGNITKKIHRNNLLKTTGLSAGLQYNQKINSKWSVGLGTQIYWQNKALLSTQTINLKDGKVLSDSLLRIGKTSDKWKLMQPNFITGNLEILYSWQKLQFGAAVIVPITSMTNGPENKQRPINGQLLIRWKVK